MVVCDERAIGSEVEWPTDFRAPQSDRAHTAQLAFRHISTEITTVPSYWLIVRRGAPELLDVLKQSFQGRRGFHVIEDRRLESHPASPDRRAHMPPRDGKTLLIVEPVEDPFEA